MALTAMTESNLFLVALERARPLRMYPMASWTWRDGSGADIDDPLEALRQAGDMDAGFAIRENQELIQAIPLMDETLTPAYLLSRRGRVARRQ